MKGKEKMKKIMKLMLAFVLTVMYLIPNVNAVKNYDENGNLNTNTTGEITITNAINGKTYYIYQMLILQSYDKDVNGYVYKVTDDAWNDFIEDNSSLLSIDAEGFVKWIGSKDEATMREFAKDALEYAKTVNADNDNSNDVPVISQQASGSTLKFDNLKLGYYLLDSSAGALCSLTTAIPEATIEEKNSVPTIKKEVLENDTITPNDEGVYDDTNSAFIGEVVRFRTTITVGKGAQNYKLYDKMDAGLTFGDDVTVTLNGNALTETTHYEFVEDSNYTFVIKFKGELAVDDKIVVEYSATVNENAVTANNNTTKLEYGDNHFTESENDTTTTYTYSFDLVKTDSSNKKLDGAKFRLYDSIDGNNEIKLVKESDGVYRVAYGNELANAVEIDAGIATIKGLDGYQTYYLEETKNPDGYTKLLDRVPVTITDVNRNATVNNDVFDVTGDGVQVVNEVGSLLPGTGGMGTVLFITVGSLMVTLFGVLLVTKFRMSKMDI